MLAIQKVPIFFSEKIILTFLWSQLDFVFSIVNFARTVPNGLLVFFPSYPVMNKCLEHWQVSHVVFSFKTELTEQKISVSLMRKVKFFRQWIREPICLMQQLREGETLWLLSYFHFTELWYVVKIRTTQTSFCWAKRKRRLYWGLWHRRFWATDGNRKANVLVFGALSVFTVTNELESSHFSIYNLTLRTKSR